VSPSELGSSLDQYPSVMTIDFDTGEFESRLRLSRDASKTLAIATTSLKNRALEALALQLERDVEEILAANEQDLVRGEKDEVGEHLLDRLMLNEERILALAHSVRNVIALPDPVGSVVRGSVLENGLQITQVRVPFGVVGAIYEARPNVTVDIAALAVKSGNCAVLRGGSAAASTNRVLVHTMQRAFESVDLPGACVISIDDFGRQGATALMHAREFVDVLIPRGGPDLIRSVIENSTVPAIETGAGVVHVFLDESAELEIATEIVLNSKTHRPSVCNAAETLLLHKNLPVEVTRSVLDALISAGVELRVDKNLSELLPHATQATETDWSTEYHALILSVKVVENIQAAIAHIDSFSTHHTETIVTSDYVNAEKFLDEVDSAVVMVNASTRFTDGGEFGFGAEVGISTQKLHARGPMGLPELTSTKWIVRGSGQVRS